MNTTPIEACGTTFRVLSLSGEVIGTEQRSDSYTTGSSRTIVIEGTGGGSGRVDTTVLVSRDVWLRDAGGNEHHIRVQADLPIRTGQRIAFLSLQASRPVTGQRVDSLVSVYAPSTDTYWKIQTLDKVAKTLSEPKWDGAAFLGLLLLWVVSLGLCLIGIGVPLVITLVVIWWRRARKHTRHAVQILDALQTEHQAVIRQEHANWRRDVDQLAKPAQAATRTIGAAE